MPKSGYMEVKMSGQMHRYANEKKEKINEGVGMSVSWNDIANTGISMIEEHGIGIIDEYTEPLPDTDEKLKRKGFSANDDVHRRGMDLKDDGVTWNQIVQVGVNVLYERHVLNEGNGSGGDGPSEERIREIVEEMLDEYDDRAAEIAREQIMDNVVPDARQ